MVNKLPLITFAFPIIRKLLFGKNIDLLQKEKWQIVKSSTSVLLLLSGWLQTFKLFVVAFVFKYKRVIILNSRSFFSNILCDMMAS